MTELALGVLPVISHAHRHCCTSRVCSVRLQQASPKESHVGPGPHPTATVPAKPAPQHVCVYCTYMFSYYMLVRSSLSCQAHMWNIIFKSQHHFSAY